MSERELDYSQVPEIIAKWDSLLVSPRYTPDLQALHGLLDSIMTVHGGAQWRDYIETLSLSAGVPDEEIMITYFGESEEDSSDAAFIIEYDGGDLTEAMLVGPIGERGSGRFGVSCRIYKYKSVLASGMVIPGEIPSEMANEFKKSDLETSAKWAPVLLDDRQVHYLMRRLWYACQTIPVDYDQNVQSYSSATSFSEQHPKI